ncbi:MAG: serine/threonine protein kinase, partial [Phycisphaerae bacterium]|nr:serine/threonine protein kinase [Phycisphaerae bacterium]
TSELNRQFPHLEILRLLGQGGMGAVYEARQTHLDRSVALKILPPHIGQTKAFSERFLREARSLARLNHARIVSIYDFGLTDNNLYYFVMEFVDGMDLRRMIQTRQLSVSDILGIVPQICEALAYAHQEGVVHRDIKPENILLDKKGQVKIADFGLAKLVDRSAAVSTLTQVGQMMGTPQYMAPEQIERPDAVDHRADIYSMGVVFYEMLTGELPLGRFAPPSEKAHTDIRLDKVVLRALNKEPDQRYQQAGDVKHAVETLLLSQSRVTVHEPFADEDLNRIQRSLRKPAVGLKVAGRINCITSLPLLLAWMAFAATEGARSHGSIISGTIGLTCAMIGLLTCVGTQRMVRIQSYGLAVSTGIIQLIPSPGFLIGSWNGIWALILILQHDVHRAFINETRPNPVKVEGKVEKITLSVLAAAATFVLFFGFLQSLSHGRFPWLLFLFGPPVVFLDALILEWYTGRADLGPKRLWERAKARVDRIIGK